MKTLINYVITVFFIIGSLVMAAEKGSPEALTTEFFSLLNKGRTDQVLSYIDLARDTDRSKVEQFFKEVAAEYEKNKGIKEFKVTGVEEEADGSVRVKFAIKYNNGGEEPEAFLQFYKKNGDWKIDL